MAGETQGTIRPETGGAGRLIAGEEEARRRLARELHDDHCQRLAAFAFELKVVRRDLSEGDARRTGLDAVSAGLAELGEDLRRLSHDLHPAILERRGLAEALGDHCTEVERRYGLPVRLSLRDAEDPFLSLPSDTALGLYRIVQEALANTARHAGARSAHVTLRLTAGEAHLAVADDGAGFVPEEVRRRGGLGLATIEERAVLLGGRCRIASAPGAGTEIDVTVPLPELDPEEPAAADAVPRPRYVGAYRLLEEIGSGAMATVYLAEEPEPLGRRVALKLHRDPLPARRETLRFKAEQQALARLQHPAIAQVHEARTTEEGDLYIVMEYVPGLPVTEYCDRHHLGLDRRLELFAAICEGVQHAHRKGVLHRDLKPSNVLVMEQDGEAVPKIIDFGVAKGLDRQLADDTVWTAGELVGTPAYLAPEALKGGEMDIRSDVYSLGVILKELLAGSVGRRRLTGDLGRLSLKALAADPAERYPTVDALCQEIRRVLRGEPIEASPPGAIHRVSRFIRRHRSLVASAALVVLALALGLGATTLQARRARQEALRADAVATFLEDLFKASDPREARGEIPDARKLLRRGTERLGKDLSGQPLVRANLLDTLGDIHTSLGLYDEARPLLREALALRERLRGPKDPEVADTLVHLGSLAHLSRKGDAVPLFQRALAIREARLGPEDPAVASVLNNLGTAFAAQGRFDEAEATLRRTLALQERLWGRRDPRVAKTLHNLGGIAYYRGRTAEAERLLQSALAIREATLPDDDLDLAGSREAIALLHLKQGRPAEAAKLLERLAATTEKVYGPEHPNTARTLLNLGLARKGLGQDAAARKDLERALAIKERSFGTASPQLVETLAALASLHLQHGRYAEAEPLYRRLLALRDQGAAHDHWDQVLAGWTSLLLATGR
jgi:serine/threonine protein kinase/Tfp pilus assembly protein PilF